MTTSVFAVFLLLWVSKLAAEFLLEWCNRREVLRNRKAIPDFAKGLMDQPTYEKSVRYTLAKINFGMVETAFGALLLLVVVGSGLLPALWNWYTAFMGESHWSAALFICLILFLVSLPNLPLDWYGQFRLEERFGFNRSTFGLWMADKLKGSLVGLCLGYPLLLAILSLVDWWGDLWWVWAFVLFMAFQLLMVVVYPMFIMPLFNKFTPLEEGSLKDRLLQLGERTGFHSRAIQVMDGSRRSAHSNAFFAGFGRFRRIVLYDTLVEQLDEDELEAVLAHEIGHYKLGHIPRMVGAAAVIVFLAFLSIAWLAESAWFYVGFGFSGEGHHGIALLLFLLCGGLVTFWISPLGSLLSRIHEYQADAFASRAVGSPGPLRGALRKLMVKNLGNLTPHPLYSAFHYSHPTLREREAALAGLEVPPASEHPRHPEMGNQSK